MWLDHELAGDEDLEVTMTSGCKEDEVGLELLLDLELAFQAELEQAPVLQSQDEGRKEYGNKNE